MVIPRYLADWTVSRMWPCSTQSGIWQDETPCPSSSPCQQDGGGLAVAGPDHLHGDHPV